MRLPGVKSTTPKQGRALTKQLLMALDRLRQRSSGRGRSGLPDPP